MKIKYIATNIIALTLLLSVGACTEDYIESNPIPANGGFVLNLDSRGPMSSLSTKTLIDNMRVMAFKKEGSTPFSHEVPILSRNENTLYSNMRTGSWDLVLVSAQGATLTPPAAAQPIATQKMYEYTPSKDPQGFLNHPGAAEIFTRHINNLQPIVVDRTHSVSTAISRNVAMIKVVFDKTPGIDRSGNHTIELGNVPSTINWAGGLLPNKNNPTLLSAPLKRRFTFSTDIIDNTMSVSDTAVFIIPAHRGTDFWSTDGMSINTAAVDTTTQKLSISVNLALEGGTTFTSTKLIPVVARCNGIMVAKLKINKTDVVVETSVKTWDTENVNGDLIAPYLNVEKTSTEVFGKFPTRVHFWSNQPQSSIYVQPKGAEITGGGNITINDINTVFAGLAGEGATNITYKPSTAGGYEGYIDLQVAGADPVGVKEHIIYLKAGAIVREIKVKTYGIQFISNDAPLAVDKNGISIDSHSLFSFTFTNPGNINFKLGLFSGTTLLAESAYDTSPTKQLDFLEAAINDITQLPRMLDIKFFAGGRWYPASSVQQRAVLTVRILTVGSNGIEIRQDLTGSARFGTLVEDGGSSLQTTGSNIWTNGLGLLLYKNTGKGKPIDMPIEVYYINKGAGTLNYDNDFVLNTLNTKNIDILFCAADRAYTAIHGPTEEQAKDIIEKWLEKNNFRGIIFCADDVSVNPNWTKAIFGEVQKKVSSSGIYERIQPADPYYNHDVYKSIMQGSYSTYQKYPDESGTMLLGSDVTTSGSNSTAGKTFTPNPVDLRKTEQAFYAENTYGIINKSISDHLGFIPLLYQSGEVAFAVHPTRRIVFQGETQFYQLKINSGFLNANGGLQPTIHGQHPKLVMNMWEWFLNNVALGKQY